MLNNSDSIEGKSLYIYKAPHEVPLVQVHVCPNLQHLKVPDDNAEDLSPYDPGC